MGYLRKNESFVDKYDKIVNRSISEIGYIRSTYKWYLGIVSTIVMLFIGIVFYLTSNSISGYEDLLNKKFDKILSTTYDKQDSLNQRFILETNKIIKALVAKNFNEKEILKTIKIVASEKVDSFSNEYLNKLVEQKITPKLNSIQNELNDADAKVQLIEFYLSKVSAYNDDRYSFEKLIEISKNKKHSYSNFAGQVVQSLISQYAMPKISKSYNNLRSHNQADFKWSSQKCIDSFSSYPKDERIVILENVFELDRFTDSEKIKVALNAVRIDESLTIVRKSSDYIISKLNLPYKNLEISKIINALKLKGYK